MLSAVRWEPHRRKVRLAGKGEGTGSKGRGAAQTEDVRQPAVPADEIEAYVEGRLSGTVWASVGVARRAYGWCMRVGQSLGHIGISPNALTYASLGLAVGAGWAAAAGHLLVAAAILLVSGVCDVLDGMIARATGQVTRFGALLDSTVDRFSDALPLLGLVILLSPLGWWVGLPAAAMLGALSVSYVRARAESLGAKLPPLFMRRAERLALLVAILIAGGISLKTTPLTDVSGTNWSQLLLLGGLGLMTILSFVAAGVALWTARRQLDAEPEPTDTTGQCTGSTDADSSGLHPIRVR